MRKILFLILILSIKIDLSAVSYTETRAQEFPAGTKIIYPDGGIFTLSEKFAAYNQVGIQRLSDKFAELNECRTIITEQSNIIWQANFKEVLYNKALGRDWVHRFKDGAVYIALFVMITDAVVRKLK